MMHPAPSLLIRFALATSLLSAIGSHAEIVTSSLTITARYQQTCSINSSPQFDFGTLTATSGPTSALVTMTGSLAVDCSANSTLNFGVSAPLNGNASGNRRRVRSNSSPPNFIRYNIYYADSNTLLSSTSTTSGYTSSSSGTSGQPATLLNRVSLRAELPAGQTLAQGYYSDTLVLTVSY